jgi:hypothetical protein
MIVRDLDKGRRFSLENCVRQRHSPPVFVTNLSDLQNSWACDTAPGLNCCPNRSVPYQFLPVRELQKMQYPDDAVLDIEVRDVQPVRDPTITEALTG